MGGRGRPLAERDFDIILPSNASLRMFPNNTPSSYTIKLQSPVELRGPYMAALDEITLPRCWVNQPDDPDPNNQLSFVIANQDTSLNCVVRAGHYRSAITLIKELNKIIKPVFKDGPRPAYGDGQRYGEVFIYHQAQNKVNISLKSNVTLRLSPRLRRIIGFQGADVLTGPLQVEAQHHVNVNEGLDALYVYVNIIHDRIVGDTTAPLLRMVPIKGEGDNAESNFHKSFRRLQWVPVKLNAFDVITINIRDGRGNLIPFNPGQGDTIATLRLAKKLPF